MPNLTLTPIGHIRTPYTDRYDAPRQPSGGADGRIELRANHNYEQALADLDGFDYIWVIFWFDRNNTWKPKVLPPRGRTKRGVFATRSPHRPNPIGISLLRLISISGRTLHVANVDLLDGTPILDIKPYIPYADSRPDAQTGWLEEMAEAATTHTVEWSEHATTQVQWLRTDHDIDLKPHTERILSSDPYPHSYRRITQHANGTYMLSVRSWRVLYRIDDERVVISHLESGYDDAALSDPLADLHDAEAHRAFHKTWPTGYDNGNKQ